MVSDSNNSAAFATGNVVWHYDAVTREQREISNGHRGVVVWLTGLPGSGKSTIANAVAENLHHSGFQTVMVDGDNIRQGLCSDLGFSLSDRNENVRRTGEIAKILLELGFVVFVALVSPIRSAREKIRHLIPVSDFFEIYCRCPLSVCRERDPKGLYAKAENGLIAEFTGISSPYEAPLAPALELDTENKSIDESIDCLKEFLLTKLKNDSS